MNIRIALRKGLYIFSAALVLLVLSCAVNPVTGKKQLMLMSKSEEIQLGEQTDKQTIETYGIYQDPQLQKYIQDLGMKMAKLSHRPDLPYEFRLLDSPVINAFAVPGGYVYITRGIMGYLNNEAELAGVMGHEIGHVAARHSAEQYSKAQLAQLGLGLGSILSENFRKYAGVAQFGVQMLFLKFSRDDERQADELGVQYSTEAGFDANQMANFFVTLDRMSPSGDQGGLPEWFSTHPNPADRVTEVRKEAKQWQQKTGATNLKVNRDSYLREIDGLIFGDDPRQGYVENNMFYHPQLRFQFPVPSGWKLNNTASQVQISNEGGDAVILFSVDQSKVPEDAAKQFITNSKLTVISSEAATINQLSAYRVVGDLTTNQGVLRILSYFVQLNGSVYDFHGVAAQTAFETYHPVFQNTIEKFRKLTDPSKINVKPDRIKVVTIKNTTSLKNALNSFGVADADMEKLSLINGMQLTDSVPAKSLIKIVQKGR